MRGIAGRLYLLLFLPCVLCSYAQQIQPPVTPGAPNQAPRRTVTGTVTNAVSGEPIRHALVQLSGTRPASVLTGSDGRFEMAEVPEGPAYFSVSKPGFFDARSVPGGEWRRAGPMFTVGPGKNDFPLTLFPAARIIGRLTDPDGEPVEQTQVQVLTEQIVNGHKQWGPRNGASTDEDGSYRLDDLLPGHYILYVSGHAFAPPTWEAPPQVIAPVYYPNAPDLASAQAIELRPGEEFRGDFHLRAERGFRIAAQLSGYPQSAGMSFSLLNASGQPVSSSVNIDAEHGRLVLPAIPSGTWTVVLSAGNQGQAYEARQEITVDHADLTDLQIPFHPDTSIPVTINAAPNQPQPQAPSPQGSANPGVNVTLISADGAMFRTYMMTAHEEPPTRSFDNVAEGKYKLDVQSFGTECLESAWYGNVDLLQDYLIVGSGGPTQPVVINLRADCATLSAKIDPGQNQSSGFLLIVPSSSFFIQPRVLPIVTQSAVWVGARFYGASATLSPGAYRVFAFATLDGLEYANPEALRDYPSQNVTLDPGQKLELTVKLTERKGS